MEKLCECGKELDQSESDKKIGTDSEHWADCCFGFLEKWQEDCVKSEDVEKQMEAAENCPSHREHLESCLADGAPILLTSLFSAPLRYFLLLNNNLWFQLD